MSKSVFICFCISIALAPGCAQKEAGLKISPALTQARQEDIPMLQSLLQKQGYFFDAAWRDPANSGVVDLELTFRRGPEAESAEDILNRVAALVGFTMAGCGYPTDQLVVHLRGQVYQAQMSECKRCAWDLKTEAERAECRKGLWLNSVNYPGGRE
jgi:hypothetical protein